MHVGVVLPQRGAGWKDAVDAARHAEEIGADSVWVVDHLLGFPPDSGILEAWTMLAALAAETARVELGAQVFCQSFRNPSLLAKMAATVDQISGGRLRMLVGAGWFEAEYKAFAYEFPSPGTLVAQLRDTVRILKGMLSGPEPFTYKGKHYSVDAVVNVPTPVRCPMPIEVGAVRNRALRLVAKEADGWNCPGAALPVLDERLGFLATACKEFDRSIEDLRLSCQIVCSIEEDPANHSFLNFFNPSLGLVGSVDQAVDRASELTEKGIEGFHVIVPEGKAGRACLEKLVGEVKPRVKG